MPQSALRDLVPITGTVVAIGSRATTDGDTTFQYLAIRERGGSPRHLTIVRASAEVAALIEPHVIGTFLFQEGQGERRLCYVYRADGPRQVDFEALQRCFVGG